MTEYDFSPEAYDRFMHTQQRIANWVDQTEEYRPQFGAAITPSTQVDTPMMNPRSLHGRRSHSMRERRRPSFSSSSDSSSTSSTDSSNSSESKAPQPAFQPMYLQHPVPDPSHRPRHADPHRRHTDQHHSPHDRSLPRSLSYGTAAPQIYGHNVGHSSGVPTILPQLKGMSLVTSPPQTPYYQPTPSYSGKHGYPFQQTIYPPAIPAVGSHPPLQNRQLIKPIYSDPSVVRSNSNSQYPPAQGAYPGAPTVYPLTAYGRPPSSMQRPVMYQRVFRDVVASGRRKESGRSRSGRRSR